MVVYSLQKQERLTQTKVYFKFFYSVQIETTHKPSKVAAAKKNFLQCVCYSCNLLQSMFFTPCDNWKTLSSVNVCRSFEIFSTVILLLSLKQVFWQKSVFYVIYTITMRYQYQSSKRKLSFTICTWQTFSIYFMQEYGRETPKFLFYDNVYTLFYILTVLQFSL